MPDRSQPADPRAPLDVAAETLRAIARVTSRERFLVRCAPTADTHPAAQVADTADKIGALLDAVAVLDASEVRYALIGGVAVGLHTRVARATVDVGLAVDSAARGDALVQALTTGGFELRGEHAHSVNFVHASGEPVQLAFDPAFDEPIKRAVVVRIEGQEVRVVTRPDLISMKRRAGNDPSRRRSKALCDLADVQLLLEDPVEPHEGW